MRVVGGDLRSRRLTAAPRGVRPTSDRVRESLFATLGDVTGARVLDLFSGTGALAIEALSRGAERAVLVDQARTSLDAIRQNLASLGLQHRAKVVRGDAAHAVARLDAGERFDLVLLDPPYGSDRLTPTLAALVARGVLAPFATLVVETSKRHAVAPVPGLVVRDERTYGDTRLTWLTPEGGAEPPETE